MRSVAIEQGSTRVREWIGCRSENGFASGMVIARVVARAWIGSAEKDDHNSPLMVATKSFAAIWRDIAHSGKTKPVSCPGILALTTGFGAPRGLVPDGTGDGLRAPSATGSYFWNFWQVEQCFFQVEGRALRASDRPVLALPGNPESLMADGSTRERAGAGRSPSFGARFRGKSRRDPIARQRGG
jgi:hypothetical protein